MKKISSSELMEVMTEICTDYQDKHKTIGWLDEDYIYGQVKQYAGEFNKVVLSRWINHIKFRKPGYVVKDLILILMMGEVNTFGSDYNFTGDTLNFWLFEYGIKKEGGEKWDKGGGETKRNKFLGEASKLLSEKNRDWVWGDKKYISLQEYIKRNPESKFNEYMEAMEEKIKNQKEKSELPVTWDEPVTEVKN